MSADADAASTPVYLEVGKKRVFACALDWPGWCRSGRSEQEALANLAAYAARYAPVPREAGVPFWPDGAPIHFEVVERLPSSRGMADFGAPGEIATRDHDPLTSDEAAQQASLVQAAWTVLDRVAATAPAELRKGPRGGGRDRDRMVEHILGAEAVYARKIGVKHRQPALGDTAAINDLRQTILSALRADTEASVTAGWPPRYAARRIAWHVLDHVWEIQDRST